MKLTRDFGVRALLAVLSLIIFAVVLVPLSLRGDAETLKIAAAIISPVVMAVVTYYFSTRAVS